MNSFKEKVKSLINDDHTFLLLEKYVNLIEKYNQVMNLTGFKGDRLWEEGIYESIVSLDHSLKNKEGHLLDIGAGAGFPSVPYIIFNNKIKLTIYESQQKRVVFLEKVKKELKLNIAIKRIRVEESQDVNTFDFITARAVASLKSLIQASYHVGKNNCLFTFIKGPNSSVEINDSKTLIKQLGLKIQTENLKQIKNKEVNIVSFNKIKPTPKGWPKDWKDIKCY